MFGQKAELSKPEEGESTIEGGTCSLRDAGERSACFRSIMTWIVMGITWISTSYRCGAA